MSTILAGLEAALRRPLELALDDRDLTVADVEPLWSVTGAGLHALCAVADALRERQAGGLVTYVVNRNINFTNVCVKTCRFCAFSRDLRSEQAYFLPSDEVLRRVGEAVALGATEVCLQAGLAPELDGAAYVRLASVVHEAFPALHLHAFSPEEVLYGARRGRITVRELLRALRDAGVGSLPGTSAEILDDAVRERIAPGRLTTAEWEEVVRTAHEEGLRTTATMMYGHLETGGHRAAHLLRLRSLQRSTGGFTEVVPLAFVHHQAPALASQPGCRPGPSGPDVVRTVALTRLLLGRDVPHVQAAWVKDGPRLAAWLLCCGADDLGGTLMNESISTAAGAPHGQRLGPADLRRLAREAGRVPAQRDTLYRTIRPFPLPADDPADPLDGTTVDLGSYRALTADPALRYRRGQ